MSSETTAPSGEPPTSSNKDESARFECNICLDAAKDAVVSLCGHLFCWPCLSQWLDTRPHNQVCPVCKSAIDGSKVVPIYGRGGDSADPRKKIPPRPKGQRTEPPPQSFGGFNWGAFGNDGGGGGGGMMGGGGPGHNVHFSFGIGTVGNGLFPLMFMLPFIQGIFPLSFVASFFGNGNNNNNNQGVGGGAGGAQGQERGMNGEGSSAPGSRMAQEEEFLSNIFKYIGIFMLLWLLFV